MQAAALFGASLFWSATLACKRNLARLVAFKGHKMAAQIGESMSLKNDAQVEAAPEPLRKKQRKHFTRPPFHSTIYSVAGKSMRVKVEVPSPDEQCPLTMSPICEDFLDFIPSDTYVASTPEARKITLPCGHSFGAMSITYHFARRDMRCPCCRAGHKQRLKMESIPFHFRAKLMAHVDKAEQEDVDEQTMEDEQYARELQDRGAGRHSELARYANSLIQERPVNLSVYMYNNETGETPATTMEFRLLPLSEPAVINSATYRLSTIHGRLLGEMISDNTVARLSLVAHTRHFSTNAVVELARTEIFSSRENHSEPGLARLILAGTGSFFEIMPCGAPFDGTHADVTPTVFYHIDSLKLFQLSF